MCSEGTYVRLIGMCLKFDVEDSTGVVEVELWLHSGNDVFLAERPAACRYGLFLAMSWLYSLMGKRQNTGQRAFQ